MTRKLCFERIRLRSAKVSDFRFHPILPQSTPFGSYPFMGYVSELRERFTARVVPETIQRSAADNECLAIALRLNEDPVYGPLLRQALQMLRDIQEKRGL